MVNVLHAPIDAQTQNHQIALDAVELGHGRRAPSA